MPTKQQRKPVKFEEGVAKNVIFDYDPSTAKAFEQDSKYTESGKVTKYLISVNKDEIIFATQALYDKIRDYDKGDNVTITFSEKRWLVTSDNASPKKNNIDKITENTETTILLRKIALDIDLIKSHLFGIKTDEKTNEYPKDEDEEIDF